MGLLFTGLSYVIQKWNLLAVGFITIIFITIIIIITIIVF